MWKIGIPGVCRGPLQYTDTSSSQQKEQRTHRMRTPEPKIQQPPPPSQRFLKMIKIKNPTTMKQQKQIVQAKNTHMNEHPPEEDVMEMLLVLPDEIVLEIFSWLPATAIQKFKSASDFFRTMPFEERYFVLKQSHNALLRKDPCFFLQPNSCKKYSAINEFHHFLSEKTSSGVPHNFLKFLENYPACRILASSNGLILGCSTKKNNQTELFISNPSTQSWFLIPTLNHLKEYPDSEINVAFECNSKDFMLFLFEVPAEWASSCYIVKLYSQEEGMWKSIEKTFFTGTRRMMFDTYVFQNNVFHVISDCFPYLHKKSPYFRPYIMAYTIEDGESRMLRVPKEARRGSHDLSCKMGIYKWGKVTSLDGSMCLVRLRKCVFTIWVLTDYKSCKWKRVLKIRVRAMGIIEEEPIIVKGFIVMNGDCLVFATKKKVYSYGLSRENYRVVEEISEHGFDDDEVYFTCYSDTLRLCGEGATTLPLLQQSY
ncbi:F-box protein [Senna tora]|uniref:F-box protein n=1 Tax=Senna tora TaxID=362788 RepID=A0A834SSF8_9FABA|nr:F-box protein [Senna tora]